MNEDRIVASKDFSNAPLCLSGRHVTKVFGFGDKKTIAVNDVSFDFHEASSSPSWASPAPAKPLCPRFCWAC